jgi:cytochrome c-type biogenesis protein CcmH/NrfG
MKPSLIALFSSCAIITVGAIYFLNHAKDPASLPAPITPPQTITAAAPAIVPVPVKPTMPLLPKPEVAVLVAVDASVVSAPTNAINHIIQAVDALVSPQTSLAAKRALLRQLHDSGELDQVIADLKQRAANNPNAAEFPTALGEAYLNKFPVDDYNEASILGMEADQSFNTALKLDPANWEAQYFKADAMSYWPVSLNKGPEVIERLSGLIDQQEAASIQQPQFAQTYVLLGDQYLKAGKPDYAQQTWRLGAAKFPGNGALQMKLGSSAN